MNIKQFKTIFIHPSDRHFITNEKVKKQNKEHQVKRFIADPEEARFLTLVEIKEEIEKNRLEMIENMLFAKRQEYETQKEYASGNYFQSIYNEKEKLYDIGAI